MPGLKRLPIDLGELAAFFDEPRRAPVRGFFDRLSGALESMPRQAEVEGVFDDIVTAPERWVEIQPLPAADRLELRRRFVDEEMNDPVLRLRLFEALDQRERPFSRFDALLREHGDAVVDRWLAFRSARLAVLARTWLAALGIEPS